MKIKNLSVVILLCISATIFIFSGCSEKKQSVPSTTTAPTVKPYQATTQEIPSNNTANTAKFGASGASQEKQLTLEKMITYAIQDEFLARAEYEHIINKYGDVKPFANIIKAEESHIAMLKPLFGKYNFSVPVDNAKDHLITPTDIKESLKTGVQAEIDNIAMYERFLKEPLNDDVKAVFTELLNASKNHLEAFQKNLNK